MHRFIVSAGRAGSSFTARAIDMHPDVFGLVESHHLPLLIDAFGQDRATPQALIAVLMTARFHTGQPIVHWNLDRLKIPRKVFGDWGRGLAANGDRMTVGEFQTAFEGFWLQQTGKTVFVDKTPCYALSLEEISAALGPIRVVHLVRDVLPSIKSMAQHAGFRMKVRAGVHSWTDMLRHHDPAEIDGDTPISGPEMVEMARLWAVRTGKPIRDAGRIGLGVEVLRYEDLVASPTEFLKRLSTGLDFRHDGLWAELVTDNVTPSRTPVSYDDAPNFAALRDLPEVAETRALCGYV